ncbi:MAG: hypothetical protein HOV94_28820 [Saccharothrix sp.]|nr:hypothetical protein [Saccharothrix sp.]
MNRTVHTTPEVVELIGAEQLARHGEPDRSGAVQCWRCGHAVTAEQDVALSVLRVVDPDAPAGAGALSYVVHSHPACGDSMVLEFTPDQFERLREQWRAADDIADVEGLDVRAAVAGTPERPYPLVLISFRAELTVEQPGPDRVDLVAAVLNRAGWHPVLTLAEPAPPGYRLRLHVDPADEDAPGLLEVHGPHGVETAAMLTPTPLWRQLVRHHGWGVLIQGSNYLHTGQQGLEQAVRSGLLAGGRLPIELTSHNTDDEVVRP